MTAYRGDSVGWMGRDQVVVLGLQVEGDAVSIAYAGPGFAALLGREPAGIDSLGAPASELIQTIRTAIRDATPWRFAWTTSARHVEAVAVPVESERGITLHGYVREGIEIGASRFQSIVEASPVPYAINDEQQNITYVNPAFVATFGYSRADIPTLDAWWPRAYPDLEYRRQVASEWAERLERAKRTGMVFEPLEVKIRAKDGTERFALTSALSLDGAFHGDHVVVLLDITERKRAEEARLGLERQVQHSQKLESLGVLAGGIAHDFNNLLMGILGNADVAVASLPAASPAVASLQAIQSAARRASEVADQMLAYAGKGKLVVASLAINELVAEMVQLLGVAISKKATLRCSLESGMPLFEGDATQVRRVIMNLITNASEAISDEPGIVTLTTGAMHCDRAYLDRPTIVRDHVHGATLREGTYVFLEVADTGCGMSPATLARIFEPFFTTKFAGRGLGLSALLGIVHGHAGAIDLRSEVGRGTTVRVLFPATGADNVTRAAPAPDVKAERLDRKTILFVDDEELIRNAVEMMLEQAGFNVLVAANGQLAIDVFRERHADITAVILDLTMPVLDGEQTFRELRLIRPDARVILSSGYTTLEVSRRFPPGQLAGFLKKPFDSNELMVVLSHALLDNVE